MAKAGDSEKSKAPIILVALAVINMLVVVGAGFMIQASKKAPPPEAADKPGATATPVVAAVKPFVSKVIPLETFTVNLLGNGGRRIAKINIELELEGNNAPEEFLTRKVKIRDNILVILSDRSYEEMLSKVGRETLREKIKDSLNEILLDAKVKTVYLTDINLN